jgi:hypothetical protein
MVLDRRTLSHNMYIVTEVNLFTYKARSSNAQIGPGGLDKVTSLRSETISKFMTNRPLRYIENNLVGKLQQPWKKERGVILLFCPGHHTRQNKPKYYS